MTDKYTSENVFSRSAFAFFAEVGGGAAAGAPQANAGTIIPGLRHFRSDPAHIRSDASVARQTNIRKIDYPLDTKKHYE